MDRLDIANHHDRLVRIAAELRRISGAMVLVSFAGYALGGVLWLQGHLVAAFGVATLSFAGFLIVVRLDYGRLWIFRLAQRRLCRRADFRETFDLLQEAIAQEGMKCAWHRIDPLLGEWGDGTSAQAPSRKRKQ